MGVDCDWWIVQNFCKSDGDVPLLAAGDGALAAGAEADEADELAAGCWLRTSPPHGFANGHVRMG